MTAQRIAASVHVPEDYLAKVLQQLAQAELLTSRRGRNGGFQLARPAGEISLLAVVNAVEPIRRIHSCPLGLKRHGVKLCPLHRRLDDAYALVEKAFAATTLEELIEDDMRREALCSSAGELLHVE